MCILRFSNYLYSLSCFCMWLCCFCVWLVAVASRRGRQMSELCCDTLSILSLLLSCQVMHSSKPGVSHLLSVQQTQVWGKSPEKSQPPHLNHCSHAGQTGRPQGVFVIHLLVNTEIPQPLLTDMGQQKSEYEIRALKYI